MKSLVLAICAAGLAGAPVLLATSEANAKIECRDGFQNSSGNWISTPYCNDAHLAQLARERGVRVSADEVRQNPAKKDELCRFLGSSGEARDYCPDDGGSDPSR